MAIKDLIFLKQRRVLITYAYGTYEDNAVAHLAATPDGGLLSFRASGFLEKWSAAGVLDWRIQLQSVTTPTAVGNNAPIAPAMTVTPSGDIYVAGRLGPSNVGVITKLTSAGAHVWSKTFQPASGSEIMHPTSISVSPVTGDIAISAITGSELAMLSFNASGVLQWSRTAQNSVSTSDSGKLVYAPDGSLRVTGIRGANNLFPHHHLSKVSANGLSVDWTRAMDLQAVSASGNRFDSIGVDSSGNAYGFSQLTHSDLNTEPTTVVKISPTGAQLWARRVRVGDHFISLNQLVTPAGDVYLHSGGPIVKLATGGTTTWGRQWNSSTASLSGTAVVGDTVHFGAGPIFTAPVSGNPQPITANLTTSPVPFGEPTAFTFQSAGVTNFALTGFNSQQAGAYATDAFAVTVTDQTVTVVSDPNTVYTYQA